MQVKTYSREDVTAIKAEVTPRAKKYIECLENHLKVNSELLRKAINKLKGGRNEKV